MVNKAIPSGERKYEPERLSVISAETFGFGVGTAPHTLTVSSLPTVTMIFPSGEKANAHTSLTWPLRVASSFQVVASHRVTRWSVEAVAKRVPSGENIA